MYMKRYSLILIIMAITLTLWGESLLTLDMKMLQALTRSQAADAWYFTGIGSADLTIKSTGNRDVKGELSLIYVPMEAVTAAGTPPANVSAVILDKASIKVQFPSLRLTMGKTRIGWGEGYVFNSGDVLYGSLSPSVDLTADSARNETAWLTLIRWSPGRTYVEAIAMAPAMNLTDTVNPMATGKPGEIWDSSAGVRPGHQYPGSGSAVRFTSLRERSKPRETRLDNTPNLSTISLPKHPSTNHKLRQYTIKFTSGSG
jgi:hypothetical protein